VCLHCYLESRFAPSSINHIFPVFLWRVQCHLLYLTCFFSSLRTLSYVSCPKIRYYTRHELRPDFVREWKDLRVLSCTCPKIRYYSRHDPRLDFVSGKEGSGVVLMYLPKDHILYQTRGKREKSSHVLAQRSDIIPDMIPGLIL
jgi:hypothetical protein